MEEGTIEEETADDIAGEEAEFTEAEGTELEVVVSLGMTVLEVAVITNIKKMSQVKEVKRVTGSLLDSFWMLVVVVVLALDFKVVEIDSVRVVVGLVVIARVLLVVLSAAQVSSLCACHQAQALANSALKSSGFAQDTIQIPALVMKDV